MSDPRSPVPMNWFSVPCDWAELAEASVDESDDGNALGAWLLDLPGARALSVSLCASDQQLKLGLPCMPFAVDSTLPTRAPEPLLDELHTAFGWELRLDTPPSASGVWRRWLRPRSAKPFVFESLPPFLRLGDPVLQRFRALQAQLAARGVPVSLRIDLSWDCCSAELAEEARQAFRGAMRRRRPRREVMQLFQVWMQAVRMRAAVELHAPVDPGRLIEGRLVRTLGRDLLVPLSSGTARERSAATPDLLFGLLSLCSLAEGAPVDELDAVMGASPSPRPTGVAV